MREWIKCAEQNVLCMQNIRSTVSLLTHHFGLTRYSLINPNEYVYGDIKSS